MSQPFRFALCIAAIGLASAGADHAQAGKPASPFGVEFTDCVESIGVALALTANVLALTPPGFIRSGSTRRCRRSSSAPPIAPASQSTAPSQSEARSSRSAL